MNGWLENLGKPSQKIIHSSVDLGCVVQPLMGWVGNEEVDINWDVSSDSSLITVLSHRGELNKEKRKIRMDYAHKLLASSSHLKGSTLACRQADEPNKTRNS